MASPAIRAKGLLVQAGERMRSSDILGGNERPLVSVGVPTYDRPGDLRRTVENLLHQTYPNLEIIVSDNHSPHPDVPGVLADLSQMDRRVLCIRQSVNIGISENHKFLVKIATGRYFLWVHDDDDLPPNYIERCLDRFRVSPGVRLVGTRADRYLDGEPWYSYATYASTGAEPFRRLSDLIPLAYSGPTDFEQYWYGLFDRCALLESLWKPEKVPFRTIVTTFFKISEKGCIDLAEEVVLKKYTQRSDFEKYRKAEYVHRPWFFRWLPRELEEMIPVTGAMISVVGRSRALSANEKARLVGKVLWEFGRALAVAGRSVARRQAGALRKSLEIRSS